MLKAKLTDIQEKTVRFGLKNPYCIYGLAPGLGKTFALLETFNRLGPNQRLLIICPSYLIRNWEAEIEKFYGNKFEVVSFKSSKDMYIPLFDDICITSYDLIQKKEDLFKWATIVGSDESHSLKQMKAQRTDFFHRAIYENSIKRLIMLTGTPIQNRVDEFYSLIALCNYNPKLITSKFLNRFSDSVTFADYFSHRHEFVMEKRGRWIRVVKWEGIQREDELREYLKEIYIRFEADFSKITMTRKDIMVDVKMPELEEKFVTFSGVSPKEKSLAALAKVPETIKYVKGLLEEGLEPIIIFTDHIESCKALATGLSCRYISGEVSNTLRNEYMKSFQDGEMRVLAATVGSFSEGVTLTRSNNLVFNDYPWVPGKMEQCEHRINRMGQTRPCVIHRIVGSKQDLYILKTLTEKTKTINKLYEKS